MPTAATKPLTRDGAPGVIVTEGGHRVPELTFTPSLFLNRTTVVYGPTKSGKTVQIKNILKTINGHCDEIIIISPSEASNPSYAGIVGSPLIHYRPWIPDPKAPKKDDGWKGTLRFLQAIWDRQAMKAAVSRRANKLSSLSSLFTRLPKKDRAEGAVFLNDLTRKRARVLDRVKASYPDDPGRRAEKRAEINEKFKRMVSLVYKRYITPHYEALIASKDITEDERYSLRYINFNPNIALVFDDCAAQLKPLFSKEIFRLFFYQNRHVDATIVLSCQDDTDLPANLRKQAFTSIFTESIVTSSNFERTANKFPKQLRQFVTEITPEVFRGYRKLAYIRDDDKRVHFYYTDVAPPAPFRFGSLAVHELCELVKSDGMTMDSDNPYLEKFAV